MDCLACGTPDTKIKESMDKGVEIQRKRVCACGAFFFTVEAPEKGTLRSVARSFPKDGTPSPAQASPVPMEPRPPPVQDSTPPAQDRHGGVGGALSSGPDPDRKGSEKTERDPEIWTPEIWNQKYGDAWTKKYQRFYGMPGDSKGCGRLADLLERLPREEILDAQRRAAGMFRTFLASESPTVVKAKHPFGFFVTEFGGLRVDDPTPPGKKPPEYG